MSRKKRLAVFASGTGSNFEAIVTACEQGKIPAETVALVCDKPSARVVERASRHGVKSFTFDPKSFASKVEMETVIADFLLNIDSLQTLNRQQPNDRLRVKFMFDRMNESE